MGTYFTRHIRKVHCKVTKGTSYRVRTQLRTIRFGSLIAIVAGVSSNIILPNIISIPASSRFASVTSIIMSALAIAIFRHDLFNVKVVVARVCTYGISVVFLAFLYGFAIFFVTNSLHNVEIPLRLQILLSIAAGLAALSFRRIQDGFNRLTNRIFYKDTYDTQRFLNEINSVILTKLNVDDLASGAASVIQKDIKSEYCLIVLNEPRSFKGR